MSNRPFTRRAVLRHAVTTLPIAAAAASVASLAHAKQTQDEVGYQASPNNGQRCDGCALWLGNGKCAAVEGDVSASGWCQLFTPVS